MLDIVPFAALRPKPKYIEQVVSQPYDVLDRQQARRLAEAKPFSFLRVIRSDLEFKDELSPYSPEIYERARNNFNAFIEKGVFLREQEKSYYIYTIHYPEAPFQRQTGLVALFSVKDYQERRIKRHELTRPEKEKDRITHIKTLKAHTGPVFLLYSDAKSKELSQNLAAYVDAHSPLYKLSFSESGSGRESVHCLYRVESKESLQSIEEACSRLDCVYIADGHHRAASAAKASISMDIEGEETRPSPKHFLAVAFPDKQTRILPYHRLVRDLNHLSKKEFIQALKAKGIQVSEGRYEQMNKRQANMCLEGAWYRLEWESKPQDALLETLAVNVLQKKVLAPILGISEPRKSERIAFVGGVHGEKKLEELVSAKDREFVLAFSMAAVKTEELLKVADAGHVMPPKSTWFEPKLRSGFVVHSFASPKG